MSRDAINRVSSVLYCWNDSFWEDLSLASEWVPKKDAESDRAYSLLLGINGKLTNNNGRPADNSAGICC